MIRYRSIVFVILTLFLSVFCASHAQAGYGIVVITDSSAPEKDRPAKQLIECLKALRKANDINKDELPLFVFDVKTSKDEKIAQRFFHVNSQQIPFAAPLIRNGQMITSVLERHSEAIREPIKVGENIFAYLRGWMGARLIRKTHLDTNLKVVSEPRGAVVFIDGKNVSPDKNGIVKIEAGERVITLRKENYLDKEIKITIPYGTTATITPKDPNDIANGRLVFHRGSLTLTTIPPGASISIDGKPGSKSPLVLTDYLSGNHAFRITHFGFAPREMVIFIPGNDRKQVEVKLDRLQSKIYLEVVTKDTVDENKFSSVTRYFTWKLDYKLLTQEIKKFLWEDGGFRMCHSKRECDYIFEYSFAFNDPIEGNLNVYDAAGKHILSAKETVKRPEEPDEKKLLEASMEVFRKTLSKAYEKISE